MDSQFPVWLRVPVSAPFGDPLPTQQPPSPAHQHAWRRERERPVDVTLNARTAELAWLLRRQGSLLGSRTGGHHAASGGPAPRGGAGAVFSLKVDARHDCKGGLVVGEKDDRAASAVEPAGPSGSPRSRVERQLEMDTRLAAVDRLMDEMAACVLLYHRQKLSRWKVRVRVSDTLFPSTEVAVECTEGGRLLIELTCLLPDVCATLMNASGRLVEAVRLATGVAPSVSVHRVDML